MQTWEMIKRLTENPKLKFEYDTGSEQGIVGIVDGNISVISCNNRPENSYLKLHSGFMKINWKLYKEPVTWQEAFQAWIDGKNICVEYEIAPSMKRQMIIFNGYGHLDNLNHAMFRNGKWYIED